MGRSRINEDLTTRVCVKGHIGNWKLTAKGKPYCVACAKISIEKYHAKQGRPITKQGLSLADIKIQTAQTLESTRARAEKVKLELELLQLDINTLEAKLRLLNADN